MSRHNHRYYSKDLHVEQHCQQLILIFKEVVCYTIMLRQTAALVKNVIFVKLKILEFLENPT